jgi:transposase
VAIDRVESALDSVTIFVHATATEAACRACGTRSGRVHAGYRRSLADLPLSGRRVRVVVSIRRFKCPDPTCTQATFSEQIIGLTAPFARRTPAMTTGLLALALALAGRAGARLAAQLGMPCCRDVLLKLIRVQPAPEPTAVTRLGVDDFALRRGQNYGTILIDLDTHRPIDVLPDRDAQTLATWLKTHPEVEVICRDRAGAYAEGAKDGAPQAIQVADRFHLWRNLAEAVEKTVTAHHPCLLPTPNDQEANTPTGNMPSPEPPAMSASPLRPERPLVIRTRQRYAAVHQLLVRGLSRTAISRKLGLDPQTVRRFADAPCLAELLVKAENRATNLDEFLDYVNRRWNEGITNAETIAAELRPRGFTGNVQTIRRYLRPLRPPRATGATGAPAGSRPAPSAPTVPKPRQIGRWMLTHPDHLGEDDKLALKDVKTRCEHLNRLDGHVRRFAVILTQRRGGELPCWIETVEADDLPALRSFASGLRRDLAAVTNGLTLPYSSGAVEGTVNRIKMLKRQMFGRAKFDLLRKRILLTA